MDELYLSFDKHLHRITEADTSNVSDEIDPDRVTSGSSVSSVTQTLGSLQSGKLTFSNDESGYILGLDQGVGKLYVGTTTSYFNFDGTNVSLSGSITASSGTIGGFTIGSDYLRDTANTFGLASTVTVGDDVRFWAGDTFANRATAAFRVTESGIVTSANFYMTGGAITGGTLDIGGADATSLHFDADGNLWLGAATYNIATNPFAVSNAGVLRAVSGTVANWTLSTSAISTGAFDTVNTMYFGTSGLSLSNTFKVTAAGALTATSATISGSITATSGTIGGWTIASDKLSAGTDADYIGLIPGTGIQMGDSTFADAEFSVTNAGVLKAVSGTIGGCALAATSIGSTTFVSGPLGSGWNISNTGTAEFQNAIVRGIIRTSVFEKDTISCVNGIVLVSSSDVLSADMTASDASTVTISGQTTFAANEVIRIKDGTDDEWMLVTSAASAPTYVVTRDLAGSYSANANPIWKTGTAVVSMGVGTGTKTGFVLMDSSSANSPYIDVYGRNSNTYTDYTLHGRFGWLKGITDADLGLNNTDKWGLYTDNGYFKGSIYGSTITGGTIQTAATGQRLEMTSVALTGYDGSDNIIFRLNPTSGDGAGNISYFQVPEGSAITYAIGAVINNDAYGLSIIKNTTNENQDLANTYIGGAFTADTAVAYTATGSTLDVVRNAPTLSGGATLTDSGYVLSLANNNTSGTGNIIDITNAGTGYDIDGTSSTWYATKAGTIGLHNIQGTDDSLAVIAKSDGGYIEITASDAVTNDTNGGGIFIYGGLGVGSGDGGELYFQAGDGGATGIGGAVDILSGSGDSSGGGINLGAGGGNEGGYVYCTTGSGIDGAGGDFWVTLGSGTTTNGKFIITNGGGKDTTLDFDSIASSNKTISFQNITGTVYVSGGTDVAVADGGTGKSSWTQYLIPYADTTTSFSQIAIGTDGQVLTSGGAGVAPSFESITAGVPYATDSGTTDAYAVTYSPAITYAEGTVVAFMPNTTNTGAATLNANTLGALTIKKNHSETLEDGDLPAGNLVVVGAGKAAGTGLLIDSYPTANYAVDGVLRDGSICYRSQSFVLPEAYLITSVKFYLQRVGTPNAGNDGGFMYAELYKHAGTFGTSSVPRGTLLATSSQVATSTVDTVAYELIEFPFTAGGYQAEANTQYCLVIHSCNGDVSNYINIQMDNSSPTHIGNEATNTWGGSYSAVSGTDLIFYLYGTLTQTWKLLSEPATKYNRKIQINTTDVTVVNTTDETTIFTTTIPKNTLGTNNGIRVRVYISDLDIATASENPVLTLTYGTTDIITMTLPDTTATSKTGYIDILLLAAGTINSQEASMQFLVSDNNFNNSTFSETRYSLLGTSTEYSTDDQTLALTWKWENANAGNNIVFAHSIIEVIR